MRQYQGNVVTVTAGAGSRQFVHLASGAWVSPGAGFATLTQTVTTPRQPFTFVCPAPIQNGGAQYALSRGWDDSGLSFTVTSAAGDVQHFGYWQERDHAQVTLQYPCSRSAGFRLNRWTFPQGVTVAPLDANARMPLGLGNRHACHPRLGALDARSRWPAFRLHRQ
jgi:hypothetical protein